jgi:hypothetical protein
MYKVVEVQAHSNKIEMMRLNYDNSKLFSIGQDGVLACFAIHDKQAKAAAALHIEPSEEILIEKNRLDQTHKRINDLQREIKLQDQNKEIKLKMDRDANDKTIRDLNEQISYLKQEFDDKNRSLAAQKEDIEQKANEDQSYLRRKHDDEKRKQKQEFQERLMSDTARYDQLMEQKEL